MHLYHDRLICYLGSQLVITLPRIYTNKKRARLVDYRHVIHSLIRKPQAFRYSRLRDDLLPNDAYKQIWQYLNQNLPSKLACKFIVELLYLAAVNNCEEALAVDVLAQIAQAQELSLTKLKTKYQKVAATNSLALEVIQHTLDSYNQLIGGCYA